MESKRGEGQLVGRIDLGEQCGRVAPVVWLAE